MAKRIKRQTETIRYPANQLPGQYSTRVTLDNAYPECTGYVVYQNVPPGKAYGLLLKDDNETYQQMSHYLDYSADTATPKSGRYTPATIKGAGNVITVVLEVREVSPTPIDFDFIFQLERN